LDAFDIHVTIGGILFFLSLALIVLWIAKRNRYFFLPSPSLTVPVTFYQTLGAFLTYLIFSLVILPIALVLYIFINTHSMISFKQLPPILLSWIQVSAFWVLFLLLVFYCFLINPKARYFIFWGEGKRNLIRSIKGFGMGILSGLVSYPSVLFVSIASKYISDKIWGEVEVEQVAVRQLKLTLGNGYLFTLMAIAVVFLVPFVEELLFRGFLQNFLKRYFARRYAIVVSAIIFSLAHFSFSQGIGNLQLILSLAVLAFFLGFIYERERTLWASFGLHATFNGCNVLLIFFSKG
jgi:uncharacterized protein